MIMLIIMNQKGHKITYRIKYWYQLLFLMLLSNESVFHLDAGYLFVVAVFFLGSKLWNNCAVIY